MTHDVIVTLAALGVAGQVLAALLLLVGIGWVAGLRGPGEWVRRAVEGYELWIVFLVSAIATGGSLFFSEIAGFVPCELCWFQRICMYPLSIVTLLAALANDRRVARYLLPLPLVGAGVSRMGTIGTPVALTSVAFLFGLALLFVDGGQGRRGGVSIRRGEPAAPGPIRSHEVRITELAGCVRAIFFPARPQIAAGKAAEHCRAAGLHPFALQRVKNLSDLQCPPLRSPCA